MAELWDSFKDLDKLFGPSVGLLDGFSVLRS